VGIETYQRWELIGTAGGGGGGDVPVQVLRGK